MTPPTPESRALAIIQRADLEPEDQAGLLADITAALREARVEAFMEAHTHLIRLMDNDNSETDDDVDTHLAWCRAQAAARKEEV